MHAPYLQLGHLQFPIFGIFAAIGLMAALTLSQRTARYAPLTPEAVWNAGMTAVLATFVFSRLLLIAFNLRSFLHYPLLILALPSLTSVGIALTAIFMLGYIRWRKLPFLPLLDAIAPSAAILWAFLSLGRIVDGTREGMPTTLPWHVVDSMSGAVHPVEGYSLLAALLIWVASLRSIRSVRYTAGQTTALGLVSSGAAIFFIDFFRLPSDLLEHAPLDPSQIIGTAMILAGAALLLCARSGTKRESGNEPHHAF